MQLSLFQISLSLLAGIAVIILLTVRFGLHPFFALLIACFVTGLILGLPLTNILELIKKGFGDIVSKLILIIVLGTGIGVLLEKNGSTEVMASCILKWVGNKRSDLALAITGFIVGLPIFCDSGYIVLNGINHSLIERTRKGVAQMSISLAAGLYSVHCLLPPHPGATAAAGALGVDFGRLIVWGIIIAIPAMLVGHYWAAFAGKEREKQLGVVDLSRQELIHAHFPGRVSAFLPVVVPIFLMTVKSFMSMEGEASGIFYAASSLLGDPAIALAIGLLLAIIITKKERREQIKHLGMAVEKAGAILVIIGAGAAFGAVLSASNIGQHLSSSIDIGGWGIWFPFLLAAILKTAQGSSTVAIVASSSIVVPLLPALGLDSPDGRILAVLSMGAGSMMISHTNDAYFWVISKFSGIDIKTMLRVHSAASLWMGLTAMLFVYLLSLLIL